MQSMTSPLKALECKLKSMINSAEINHSCLLISSFQMKEMKKAQLFNSAQETTRLFQTWNF